MVQAVGGAGLTTLATDLGAYTISRPRMQPSFPSRRNYARFAVAASQWDLPER